MLNPFEHLEVPIPPYLVELLSIDSKSALKKYCRDIVITDRDFAVLVWNASSIGYSHALQHHEFRPEHLEPTADDVAGLRNRNAQNFVRKLNQLLKDRRLLVCHLFYNSNRWHLFYFDQRDTQEVAQNHWKKGSHVHFVNDLWPGYNPDELWNLFNRADASVGGKLHIPFKRTAYPERSA